jgi:hypothetical protein
MPSGRIAVVRVCRGRRTARIVRNSLRGRRAHADKDRVRDVGTRGGELVHRIRLRHVVAVRGERHVPFALPV